MPCELIAGALLGVQGIPVRVEVDILRRLPATQIVGLAASAVREAAERVRSALHSSGFEWPRRRVVVNLAPADLRKEGTAFDLPIALGVLGAIEQIPSDALAGRVYAGELALSGELRPIRGTLSLALMAREAGYAEMIVPYDCAAEASVVKDIVVYGAHSLADVVDHLQGHRQLPQPGAPPADPVPAYLDLAEVRGQHLARRALEVAAAGGHNLLMMGPPGCGKTMLAARLPTILPSMTFEEAVEATSVHSVAGLRRPGAGLMSARPFRAPHHSISAAGMVGSARLRPGEASLAHNGVLFLDELPEFQRNVLELLRDPLENRRIVLTRAAGTVEFPAGLSLVAAANPCPCGFLGHPRRPCGCSEDMVQRYRSRMSGPLLDRIDMHVELQPVRTDELMAQEQGESSLTVRRRVRAARERQLLRYEGTPIRCNADLSGERVREVAELSRDASDILRTYLETFALSGRAHARLLKVARTLADLEGADRVQAPHLAEAIQYRGWERNEDEQLRNLSPLPSGMGVA